MHHCKASRLSSWYGFGIFRSDKGAVEFNRKARPLEKNRVSRMHTCPADVAVTVATMADLRRLSSQEMAGIVRNNLKVLLSA